MYIYLCIIYYVCITYLELPVGGGLGLVGEDVVGVGHGLTVVLWVDLIGR